MKIAFFVSYFPALSITFILDQIVGLIDRGHDVYIFADRDGGDEKVHRSVSEYDLLNRTCYFGVPAKRWARAIASSRLLASAAFRPARLARTILARDRGPLSARMRLLFASSALGMCRRFDVVHCHFGPNGALAISLRDMGFLQGPVVTTFHGYDVTRHVRRFGSRVYRRLFERGDLFLPISDHWRRRLIELGCPPGRIRVHHMGVDRHRFEVRPVRAQDGRATRLITIARLVEKKGVSYAIRAVRRLIDRGIDVEYDVVGDGPLGADLRALVDSLDLGQVVRMLGWQAEDEVRVLLERADILVAPSVTAADGDQEGIPMVLMEAAAMGMPVVSTHHSGIGELVEDGVSGYLLPERDAPALADRLEELIEQPKLWGQFGRAGRRIIEERFDIERLNDDLEAIFARLATRSDA